MEFWFPVCFKILHEIHSCFKKSTIKFSGYCDGIQKYMEERTRSKSVGNAVSWDHCYLTNKSENLYCMELNTHSDRESWFFKFSKTFKASFYLNQLALVSANGSSINKACCEVLSHGVPIWKHPFILPSHFHMMPKSVHLKISYRKES